MSLLDTLRRHTESVSSVSSVSSVAWSPLLLGQKIASGSYDDTIKIWDAHVHECIGILRGHTNGARSVAWSPD